MSGGKRLTLSRNHRMLLGVCGGIADWLGWSPNHVRFLYVLISCISVGFPGILVYFVLYVVMPSK